MKNRPFRYRNLFTRSFIPVILLVFVFANLSCEDSFDPLQENDRYYFSMYGFLNASADTQWVRVSPAREQLELKKEELNFTVTIEDLETGVVTEMNDSIFTSEGDFNYFNFWTTVSIEHNKQYRIHAFDEGERSSSVTVTLPNELPTPIVRRQENFGQPTTWAVFVDDDVNLADVQSKYYAEITAPNLDTRRTFSFPQRNEADTLEAFGGTYSILIEPAVEVPQISEQTILPPGGSIEIVYRQIYVASAGPDWRPDMPLLSDEAYALPETVSNVENGVGYVIGIDSKYVPFKYCETEEAVMIPCEEEDRFWLD